MITSHREPLSPQPESLTKAGKLRRMLTSPELEFIMEAHNGLSAKIVEEAGFKGIWASGLSMSAALGVRDNNEASWTQVLEVLEFMADATTIPILVDGDTGWGNFNNMRRAVAKFCQRGIAGICIEDKLFPKTNSFIGEGQPLADKDEFAGKIKAGKDSQTDPDFCIVARLEAFIAGRGLNEALDRAHAYAEAGADAVLCHSKLATADEIMAFMRQWDNRVPVVIVPTKYYATPTDEFRRAGISLAIWANHNLRAAITAMRETTARILREESLAGVEPNITTVSEIFEIQGNDELKRAEARYLPKTEARRAVVLAASRGKALGALTADRPKCMIDVRGRPLLARLTDTLKQSGIRDITVVRGYARHMINLPGIQTVDNDFYDKTGEVGSLACARDAVQGDCVIAYGDILFRHHLLDKLFETPGDIIVVVDGQWRARGDEHQGDDAETVWVRDFAECSIPFAADFMDEDAPVTLTRMGPDLAEAAISGEWVGLARVTEKGAELVRGEIDAMLAEGLSKSGLPELFSRLVAKGHAISVAYVAGQWMDIDQAADLNQAKLFL
ncbi:MAG: phosphoenolpyruvate mutase [Rhodospirillales bacterium CG15_BIG_FIL_POST_REV_8_21_14_020_66_15]|nr:MAG: phosphoenolpyruvate mutase [Rhodospirillales bacterium CG15_BIG_FIL_POST_REV_8_21_14_020_66_15]